MSFGGRYCIILAMKQLKSFIEKHWDGCSPLLVAYSGGPDSKALLYALFEFYAPFLHVAHVDHGWRHESAEEAEKIKKEIESLGLPFHRTRLTPPQKGNKEAVARRDRFLFFLELKEKFSFQACLLAHHTTDLAETVLKRVFEGARLPSLGSMQEVSFYEEMAVWRPFLSVSRVEIFSFLQKKRLDPLIDPSNSDPIYLRARMRSDIFPFLTEKFGKEIEHNLSLLGYRSSELKEYLDKKIASVKINKGPWGSFFSFLDLERIEARHLLQKVCPLSSRELLESMLDALLTKKTDCRFSDLLFVDRGILFILSSNLPQFTEPLPLALGKYTRGDWKIEVSEGKGSLPETDWEKIWSGSFSVGVADGILVLPPVGSRFKKLWNEKKVPSFLRFQIPVLIRDGIEVKEFLSGKKIVEKNSFFQVDFCCN